MTESEPAVQQGSTAGGIRVLVVDDHQVVAHGLALLLSRHPGLEVMGVATTGAEAVRLGMERQPNVVLLDFHLPDMTGAEVAQQLRRTCPNAALVVLTADASDEILFKSIEAGACGFMLKSEAASQVVESVRRAAEGEMLIPGAMLLSLLSRQRAGGQSAVETDGEVKNVLTAREHEILQLMSQGLDNRSIADRLVISYSTVRTHVQNVLDKLEAHSKLDALARAHERGLLLRAR